MQSSQQINQDSRFGTRDSKIRATSDKLRATIRYRIVAASIFAAISAFFLFFALGAHFHIDMGDRLGRCGFKMMYHIPCPTCGYTTATLAFSQGNIIEAFNIQPACALLCSLFVFIAIISFIIAVFGIKFRFINKFFSEVKFRHIIFSLIVIVGSGWAVTLARAIAQRS